MFNEKQGNLCSKINKDFFGKNLLFLVIYDGMLKLIKNKVEKKTYYKFLDLITLYTNRYNKVNFDKYKKDSKLSKTIFNDFRAELSRNAVIMKTTTTLWGFDWYMNPLISRKWSSNYTELLWLFLDKTKEIYWIDIETFL